MRRPSSDVRFDILVIVHQEFVAHGQGSKMESKSLEIRRAENSHWTDTC